jgi:hypothetical protein
MRMNSNNNVIITCVKYNRAKIKAGKREESTKMLLDFFKQQQGKVKDLSGYLVLENMTDEQESIVLTFWQKRKIWIPSIDLITKYFLSLLKKQSLYLKCYLNEVIT